MKKKLDQFFSVINVVIGAIFILILLLLSFGKFQTVDLSGKIVSTLLIFLAVLYVATAIIHFFTVFSMEDAIREVLVYNGQATNTKVTRSVIRKLVRKYIKPEKDVRLKGSRITLTEHGLALKIVIGISGTEVQTMVEYLHGLMADVFIKVLHLRFTLIDFKVTEIKSKYAPDREGIKQIAEDKVKDVAPQVAQGVELEASDETKVEDKIESAVDLHSDKAVEVVEVTDAVKEEKIEVSSEPVLAPSKSEENVGFSLNNWGKKK